MGLRPVVLPVVLSLALSLSLGCGLLGFGGGRDEPVSMEIIQFEDDEPVPESEEAVARALSIDPEILVEIRFLYRFQVHLEGLRQVIRDLNSALGYSGPADVDLDWVIEVHEVTLASDEFFRVLTSMKVPESQREQYQYLHVGMLETVQVAGYGADRLLAASVVVGPSGRSMLNMSREETGEFETLVRESRFFLPEAERRIDRRIGEIGRAIGGLGLR